jgi:hypothetical protein
MADGLLGVVSFGGGVNSPEAMVDIVERLRGAVES